MFTIIASNISSWFQQTDHGASIVPDLLSFGSRSVLVRSSFVSRSSLVRLSFVSRSLFVSLSNTERGPNEEQAKNERKSNEYRSRCRRETIGNSTSSHRHGWQNTLLQPQTSILPITLLLPRQIAALSAPLRTFSWRIKPFPPILYIPCPNHHKSLSQAPKSHLCTKPNNRPKHTTLPTLNALPRHDNRIRHSLNSRSKTTFTKPKEQS